MISKRPALPAVGEMELEYFCPERYRHLERIGTNGVVRVPNGMIEKGPVGANYVQVGVIVGDRIHRTALQEDQHLALLEEWIHLMNTSHCLKVQD